MKKLGMVGVALAGVLLLAGCGEAEQPAGADAAAERGQETQTPEPTATTTPTETAAPAVDVTAPGEVCDIASMQTLACEQQYPEQGYLNSLRRTEVALPGIWFDLSDSDLLALGQSVCDARATGSDIVGLISDNIEANAYIQPGQASDAIVRQSDLVLCP